MKLSCKKEKKPLCCLLCMSVIHLQWNSPFREGKLTVTEMPHQTAGKMEGSSGNNITQQRASPRCRRRVGVLIHPSKQLGTPPITAPPVISRGGQQPQQGALLSLAYCLHKRVRSKRVSTHSHASPTLLPGHREFSDKGSICISSYCLNFPSTNVFNCFLKHTQLGAFTTCSKEFHNVTASHMTGLLTESSSVLLNPSDGADELNAKLKNWNWHFKYRPWRLI